MPNFVEVTMQARVYVGFVHAQLSPTENRTDHIVEVVSDATGELADSLEFLTLTQLLFQG